MTLQAKSLDKFATLYFMSWGVERRWGICSNTYNKGANTSFLATKLGSCESQNPKEALDQNQKKWSV